MKADEDACLAGVMDGFVPETMREELLLRVIEECPLHGRQAPGDRVRKDVMADSQDPMDIAAALDRLDGDRAFLQRDGGDVPRRIAGPDGADPRRPRAWRRESLVAPAHNLKNWASSFVATATVAALARLEGLGRAGRLAAAGTVYSDLEREFERLTRALFRFDPEPPPKATSPR